jgi:hypothetical protein
MLNQGDKEIYYELLLSLFAILSQTKDDQLKYIVDIYELIETKIEENLIAKWLSLNTFMIGSSIQEIKQILIKRCVNMSLEQEQLYIYSSPLYQEALAKVEKEKEALAKEKDKEIEGDRSFGQRK